MCVLCAPCPVCSVVPAARKPSQRELRFGTIVDQDAATLASGPTHATAAGFLASSQRNGSGRRAAELPLAEGTARSS